MDKLTYRQAYDKIIEAYFKDEIRPFRSGFCFCGTLNNQKGSWVDLAVCETGYTGEELFSMETALYVPLQRCGLVLLNRAVGNCNQIMFWEQVSQHPEYEDALFDGMASALEVLRQIHIERGENVDEDIPAFTKRELVKVH